MIKKQVEVGIKNKQVEVGIDVVNDGEQGRVGFQTYLMQRMSGFGGASSRPYGKEFLEFPQFTERMMQRIPKTGKVFNAPQAIAEIQYLSTDAIDAEVERLTRLGSGIRANVAGLFMNAPSPGIVACTMLNAYYDSQEAYLNAIARELRKEYARVVDAGFVLQIDAPDLAMERVLLYQDLTDAEFARTVEQHVAALNKALEGCERGCRASAFACTCAGATGKGRTITTWTWRCCCPRSTTRRSVRSGSSSRTRAGNTKRRRSPNEPCPMTWC